MLDWWDIFNEKHLCHLLAACLIPFFFLSQSLTLAQAGVQWCSLGSLQPLPPTFKQFSASASRVAGITGACHHTRLIFVFLVEMGFHHVGQVGLELLTSGDLLTLASQSAGITSMSHHTWPNFCVFSRDGVSQCCPGQSAVVRCQVTATSTSQVQAILIPQPPKYLGLQACTTTPR